MPFVIVFLVGCGAGALLYRHFAGVADMKAELERLRPKP